MAEFYERYWEDNEHSKMSDFSLKWPVLQKMIPRGESGTILDFGCGNGEILREIWKFNPEASLIGMDVSETALESAWQSLKDVSFHKITDGGALPVESSSVDFIFTSEVVEHIYDTENAFSELGRVLKPGGRILLTTPYHGLIKNLLIVLTGFDKHFDPLGQHVRFFSKKTLFSCLEQVEIKPRQVGTYGRFWPIPYSIYILGEKRSK